MLIRKAEIKDVDAVADIYERIHDQEEAGIAVIGWERNVYPTAATAHAAIERGDFFVMEDEGEVVASAVINQIQVPEYENCKWEHVADDSQVMVLHTLTVDPNKGGHGYGKGFVEFYETYAKEMGCLFLRMDTNARNTRARALYKSLGYSEPGIVDCVFNGIAGVKLVCLEKRL